MNVPASISSFMTSSCQRYRSISLQAINIKMKFLSVLSKASWHQLFSQFFPCKHWIPLHQSFIQPILFQFLSSHKKLFFSPPSIFDFSFLAEVHEYYFTLHCGCISIDQGGLKDVSWPCGATNNGDVCNDFSAPGSSGRQEGCVQVCANESLSFLAISHPAQARHFQEEGVFKEHLILKYHLYTIPSLTNISECSKSQC